MSQWQRTLKMTDVWNSEDIPLIARTAAQKLKSLPPFVGFPEVEEEKLDLIEELESLAEDPETTAEDFDDVWSRVYDWGDGQLDSWWNGKKVCWIQTF